MAREYVNQVEGVYKVAGTRVTLDSLVYCFREGLSAEAIAESFPSLTLEQVYGAIAFYLAEQKTVDEYLRKEEASASELEAKSRQENADLIRRLQRTQAESTPW